MTYLSLHSPLHSLWSIGSIQLLSISLCFGLFFSLHPRSCLSSPILSAMFFFSCEVVSPYWFSLMSLYARLGFSLCEANPLPCSFLMWYLLDPGWSIQKSFVCNCSLSNTLYTCLRHLLRTTFVPRFYVEVQLLISRFHTQRKGQFLHWY